MKECSHCVCFQIKCHCNQEQPTHYQQTVQADPVQGLYSKFANTLQQQLRSQHQKYSSELDDLNNQLFTSKNTITRLELRNKKDLESLNQLRRQYNLLLQKVKNQETKVVRQVETVEKIREVPVHSSRPDLEEQILYWKKKAEENSASLHKLKMEKEILEQENLNLKDQIPKQARAINKLQNQIEQLNSTIADKDRLLDKSTQQIEFLKNNRQVVVQTKHLFPDFKSSDKVRTQTKVQTIYVEKPIEKVVFVDVEKRIKEFVQPERAVVNRIITCEPSSKCKCDDQETYSIGYRTQIANLQSCINQLQENVNSYRAERGKLVDIIDSKNSQLNYVQSKMRLFGVNQNEHVSRGPSTVNVVVSRVKQPQQMVSPKGSVRTTNILKKK